MIRTIVLAFGIAILAHAQSPADQASKSGDSVIASLQSKADALQQRLERLDKYLTLVSTVTSVAGGVTGILLLLVTGASAFYFLNSEKVRKEIERAEKQLTEEIEHTREIKRGLETQLVELKKKESLLEARQREIDGRFEKIELLGDQLDKKHADMLANIPVEIALIRESLRGALDDRAIADAATLYKFYPELSDETRQSILMHETKVPVLLFLSAGRSLAAGDTIPEDAPGWANLMRGLGIFYAGKAYEKGWYRNNGDFLKACFYFRYAIKLNPENFLAWNDLAAVLLSVEDNSRDLIEAERVLRKIATKWPDMQRPFCNLAWVYMGMDKPQTALDQLGDDILVNRFKPDGPSMPELVHLMRCFSLIKLGQMGDAYASLKLACGRPQADVQRLLEEERGALQPLLDDQAFGMVAGDEIFKYRARFGGG